MSETKEDLQAFVQEDETVTSQEQNIEEVLDTDEFLEAPKSPCDICISGEILDSWKAQAFRPALFQYQIVRYD